MLLSLRFFRPKLNFPTAEILLLCVAFFWGTSYGISKDVLLVLSVFLFLTLRFFLTFLLLFPALVVDLRFLQQQKAGSIPDAVAPAVKTGLILFSIFVAESFGVVHTTAGKAAFLISICVLLTPFVQWLVDRKRPAGSVFVCVSTSLIGIYLLCDLTGWDKGGGFSLNWGDIFILVAALLRAIMVVSSAKVMQKQCLSARSLTAIQAATVAIFSLCLLIVTLPLTSVFQQIQLLFTRSLLVWELLYLVVFCSIFAFFVQNYALKRISATRVSLLMGSEPLFGAIFAIYWLGESYTQWQLLGGVIIVISVVFTTLYAADKGEEKEGD